MAIHYSFVELCILDFKFLQVRQIFPGSKSVVIPTVKGTSSIKAVSCYSSKSFRNEKLFFLPSIETIVFCRDFKIH